MDLEKIRAWRKNLVASGDTLRHIDALIAEVERSREDGEFTFQGSINHDQATRQATAKRCMELARCFPEVTDCTKGDCCLDQCAYLKIRAEFGLE